MTREYRWRPAALILTGLGCFLISGPCAARPAGKQSHAAARSAGSGVLTGGYDGPNDGSLEIQTLSGNRVQFQIFAFWEIHNPYGPHTGDATGVVTVRNGTAVYRADGGRLTFRFQGRKITVVQSGGDLPYFGAGVDATGTYVWKRRKARIAPNLED